MKKTRASLPLGQIHLNAGQLEWLPKNPRQWTKADLDRTAASIDEDPDFLEERPILVVPFGGEYIAFAGNLRHEGAAVAGLTKCPCVIYHPETDEDRETILRRALKDNGSFGSWDFDELANSWDDFPLEDFGIPAIPADVKSGDAQAHKDEIHVRCNKGDIWQLGEHRLMCGDSIDLEQVKTLMGGGRS